MYTLAALFSSLLTLSRSCQPPFSFRLFVVSLSLLPIYSQSLDKHFFLLVPTWIRLSMLFSSLIPHAPTTTSTTTVRRLFPLLLLYTHDDTHNRDHRISLRVASSGWENKADAFSLLFFFFSSSSYSLTSFFYRLSEAMFDLLCGDDNK